jgi:hypothetical protein
LGFRILEYRREPEIVSDSSASAPAASTTTQGAGS